MTDKCLTTNCSRAVASAMKRGLCLPCYSKAKKMVDSGTTTWDELVSFGLALPLNTEGSDPFTAAFNEARARK